MEDLPIWGRYIMELNGPQKPWSIFGPKKESFAGYVPSIAKKTTELVGYVPSIAKKLKN